MAPHPELHAIPWATRPLLRLREGRAEHPIWSACSMPSPGLRRPARLTLLLAPQRPTTLNLLADTEIVLLRASRLVGAYEEAWDLLRAEIGGMPRNVMLVTGPSRSADIEQTLELGAHGPRRLHVVLVEDEPCELYCGAKFSRRSALTAATMRRIRGFAARSATDE